jgi:hypothetical protein
MVRSGSGDSTLVVSSKAVSAETSYTFADRDALLVCIFDAIVEGPDEALRVYANHPHGRRVSELVSRPRTRFVGHPVPPAG